MFASANFYETKGVKDINFADEIIAGKTRARVLSITDSEYLPDECPVYERTIQCLRNSLNYICLLQKT